MARITKARKLPVSAGRLRFWNLRGVHCDGVKMIQAMTACQARAARAMMMLSVRQLALRSKVSDSSIRRIEIGFGIPENVTMDLRLKLQAYFEGRGLVFTWDERNGPGVCWNRQPRRRAGDRAPAGG